MGEFTMPSLGADMDEGTLLEWRVGPGDHVERGDIVALVDTEKSTIDVEVFETGVIEELLVPPGTKVAVGTPLARVRADGATGPAPDAPPPHRAEPATKPATMQPPTEPMTEATARPPVAGVDEDVPRVLSPVVRHLADRLGVDTSRLGGTGVGHRITRHDVEEAATTTSPSRRRSSPWARRRARRMGVDLGRVAGSGPDGAVRSRDLDTAGPEVTPVIADTGAVAATAAVAATPTVAPMGPAERKASIRRAIARLMSTANREIPHYHLSTTIDLHAATVWLDARNAGRPNAERLLPAALLLRATALAVADHPELNGFWIDDGFRAADGVHLGVAISLRGGGLVAPAILHADQRSLDETMAALRDLVARARQGSLRASELGSASVTVTNLGEGGADAVFGVIHPPQVALVGFGGIVDRPWAVDGLVGVRPTVTATLSGDHRATDGHIGSRLLARIDDLLQRPTEL